MVAYNASVEAGIRNGQILDELVDETSELISAEKVIGTTVYNADGDDLGIIHDLMLQKRDGRVAYAVMSFGGFLGIGEKFHPLPWHVLKYDELKGGYNLDLSSEQLRGAPSYSSEELSRFGREENEEERVASYYNGLGYPPTI